MKKKMKWNKLNTSTDRYKQDVPRNTKVLLFFPDDHYASHRFRIGKLVYDRPGFDCPKEWYWQCDGYMSSTKYLPAYWTALKFKEPKNE